MAARLFQRNKALKQHLPEQGLFKEASSALLLARPFPTQSKQEQDAYLHNTILENITYFKALARYRNRRNKYIIYSNGRQSKNLRMYFRITEKGLCLLKTGYAKKPKNPI